MEVTVTKNITSEQMQALVDASHGAVTRAGILQGFLNGTGHVVIVRGITFGVDWSDGYIAIFGFHGTMDDHIVDDIDEYTVELAKSIGVATVKFFSPRKAWMRLITKIGYKTSLIVYEKEI